MKFVFWHHDIHGPLSLEELWAGTHGFAGSVSRLRILFWIASRGHSVYLTGNVKNGDHRGVVSISGEPWSDERLARGLDGQRPTLIMQTAPSEEAWQRLKASSDFTAILWLAGPLPHPHWIARARTGELGSIVCISQYQRNLYRIYRGFERLEVCYLGVDCDLMGGIPVDKAPVPVAMFCSIPRHTKGIQHLLKAWRLVHKEVPEAQLWISGSARIHDPRVELGQTGVLEPTLEQEFSDFFGKPPDTLRQSGIQLLGAPRDIRSVYRAMASAWVAVVNCNWAGSLEMFCRSAVEAQALGTPVIGARAGSLLEVIKDQATGILVARRNIPALADALVRLFTDDAARARMSEAAVVWSRQFADYEPLVTQWERLAARTHQRQPAPLGPRQWPQDLLRALGYGALRAWARDQIRGTRLEKHILDLIRKV